MKEEKYTTIYDRSGRQKRKLMIWLAIMGAALLLIAGVVWGISFWGRQASGPSQTPTPSPVVTQAPEATPTADPGLVTPDPSQGLQTEEPGDEDLLPTPTPVPSSTPVPPDPSDQKVIALTFDDGPHPTHTITLLDLLKEKNAKATFFVLGERSKAYPDILKRMVAEGHEIGNHSYDHRLNDFLGASDEVFDHQVFEVNRIIEDITGVPVIYFRRPGSPIKRKEAERAGMIGVRWAVDSEDWKSRDAKVAADLILSQVKDGDIVLLHDLYATSVEAAKIVIDTLSQEGYKFVTVSELFEHKGAVPTVGSVYRTPVSE